MSERQTEKIGEDTEKGVRGPNIPDDWRRYIMERAIKEPYKPRMLLADEILEQMKTSRDVRDRLPEKESIAKIISTALTHKNMLDEPWALAESTNPINNIPPEATHVLLHVWKLCLALGYTLTIREAQWIARIRTAIPLSPSRLGKLFYYAHEYAIRERVSAISKKAFDTRDLDAELIMGDRERITFEALGFIPPKSFAFIKEKSHGLVVILSEKGDASHLAILENIPKNAEDKLFNDKEQFDEEKYSKMRDNIFTREGIEQIANTPEHTLFEDLYSYSDGLTQEQDRIFAATLVYLSKGTLWNTLSMDDYISILSYLKEGVTKTVSSLDLLRIHFSAQEQNGLKPEHIISPEILQMVGHLVNNAIKEAQNEGTHTQEG